MRRVSLILSAFLVACGSTPTDDAGNAGNAGNAAAAAGGNARPQATAYALAGFAVYADGDRLWVFREGSEDLQGFLADGEPAKRVSLIGAGPEGKTLYGSDAGAMKSYALGYRYRLPGFAVFGDGDRLWVFRSGSDAMREYCSKGEPAKRVTLVAAGPEGRTLYGSDSAALKTYADSMRYATPGFVVVAADERLWVFRDGSANLREFVEKGEPAKRVALIGVGPDGKTLYGSDKQAMEDFAATWKYRRDGFSVLARGGRLWVFRAGGPAYAQFLREGEPAKCVTRVGAGPDGMTVRGGDEEAVAEYCAPYEFGQPRFAVIADDGRLWVFRAGSSHHRTFLASGEPAKSVTLVGAGPGGHTLRGVDRETLDDYLAHYRYAAPGFVVHGDEGRLWVFRAGSKNYQDFLEKGEPAKRISLIGAGPDDKTLYGAERETLQAYIDSFQQQ